MLPSASFYFLRHGETDWNQRRIIQGQTDTPLNAKGVQQAEFAAAHVAALPVTTICCSTLQRARRTAEIVNRGLGKPIVAFADLMECGFGPIEGQASNGPWRAAWEKGGPMPGGETFGEYTARVVRGLAEALAQPSPVLVVGHGGNFWALEHFGLIAAGTRVPNCALFKLDPPQAGTKLWSVTLLAAPAGESLAIGEAPTL